MSRDQDSVWTLKQAYPNNRNILKDHLKHAALHSETHWDKQCNVAGVTRALHTSSDSVLVSTSDFVVGLAGWSAASHFSALLPLLVCVQKREDVPGWLPMPPGTGICLLCPSAHLRARLWWTLPEQETVSVQKCSYHGKFWSLIPLLCAALYL